MISKAEKDGIFKYLKELICLYKANIYNTNQKLQNEIKQLFSET